MTTSARWGSLLVLAAEVACMAPAAAQEFGLYLICKGQVEAKGKNKEAHLDLALRRNSGIALIQRSDVLPVGEKMRLDISPTYYTMSFKAPVRGSTVYYDWLKGALFVWNPDLQKLQTARLSVDRQSAALEGDMVDGAGKSLGRMTMKCEPKTNDSVEAPKF
jgi:hypothetical protein